MRTYHLAVLVALLGLAGCSYTSGERLTGYGKQMLGGCSWQTRQRPMRKVRAEPLCPLC